jgi:hypothetical protein
MGEVQQRVTRMRHLLVGSLLRLFNAAALHERGRQTLFNALPRTALYVPSAFTQDELGQLPYDDLPSQTNDSTGPVVMITARFRTGSTLLWQLFRDLPGTTAYYEPFNERRWFDQRHRGDKVDSTHRDVSGYWREYEDLGHLSSYFEERWSNHTLYMDETSYDPSMNAYVNGLLAAAEGVPVLQFNRADFRLPWFKRHNPKLHTVHLYRHPRDQWVSTLSGEYSFPLDGTLSQFEPSDRFYLQQWIGDLQWQFPVLAQLDQDHPYLAFYLLWRLSYLYGNRHSDISVSYEALCESPELVFSRILTACSLPQAPVGFAQSRVGKSPPSQSARYATDDWYTSVETRGEQRLVHFYDA